MIRLFFLEFIVRPCGLARLVRAAVSATASTLAKRLLIVVILVISAVASLGIIMITIPALVRSHGRIGMIPLPSAC